MSDPPPEGYPVTIARIEMKLDTAISAHAEEKADVRRRIDDHEDRLRAGERYRWAIPLTLLVALAGAGAGYGSLLGK